LANRTPKFFDIKGAGLGDHATNHFMRELRKLVDDRGVSDQRAYFYESEFASLLAITKRERIVKAERVVQ
jgi:hypothetical protein